MEPHDQRWSTDLSYHGNDPIAFLVAFCDNNLDLCL